MEKNKELVIIIIVSIAFIFIAAYAFDYQIRQEKEQCDLAFGVDGWVLENINDTCQLRCVAKTLENANNTAFTCS